MGPKCGACDTGYLHLKRKRIPGGNFEYMAAVCASCGAMAGIVDTDHLPSLLFEQNKLLNKIATAVGVHSPKLPER